MTFIAFLLYDCIFFLGLLLYLPFYAFRRKITLSALQEKFGLIPIRKTNTPCIWIQVVSVGEAILIEALVKRLRDTFDYPIVISTTTLTGNRIAKKKYASYAHVIFFPFDLSLVVDTLIRRLKPHLFIAVETEIWPNLFYNLTQHKIPILIINGRISDRAFRRYMLVRPAVQRALKLCRHVGVQNEMYRKRFLALGCDASKIVISGNLKFESITVDKERLAATNERFAPVLKPENHLLLIAASTHQPEEETMLDIYRDIADFNANVSLLIAPRHVERIEAIEEAAHKRGFPTLKMSQIHRETGRSGQKTVYLLDTIGELLYFYAIADICFVGGSLARCGGHNILEPVYFSKPTVFGPYMDNFRDIEAAVLGKGAGIKAKNAGELKEMLLRLISDTTLRHNLAMRCARIFNDERQGLEKNIEMIRQCLTREAAARNTP
ncbi:MAG: glycosyltransferase N-terminal domain-containing protein [Candidatus Omnitrophica bacterium]|nr:glycosyltransferase N-terminal domain-containing protein [Candidatus Omnitrophota bacterium]